MSKKHKFKINLIDILVVALIAVLIFAAYNKFNKYNVKTEDSSEGVLNYTMNIYNVRDYSVNAYQIGDIVYDALTGVNIGTITNLESKDAITFANSQNGKIAQIRDPYKKDLTLYIETPGTVESNAYYANKSIELKVNSQKAIETKYVKTTGIISGITVK